MSRIQRILTGALEASHGNQEQTAPAASAPASKSTGCGAGSLQAWRVIRLQYAIAVWSVREGAVHRNIYIYMFWLLLLLVYGGSEEGCDGAGETPSPGWVKQRRCCEMFQFWCFLGSRFMHFEQSGIFYGIDSNREETRGWIKWFWMLVLFAKDGKRDARGRAHNPMNYPRREVVSVEELSHLQGRSVNVLSSVFLHLSCCHTEV